MNFQAQNLMELVGNKKPTTRRNQFIVRLLNCIRALRSIESINKKQIRYLIEQLKERDKLINELTERNIQLANWKISQERTSRRLNIVA